MARYFGVPLRNGLPIGLGSTIAINRAVRQALPPPSGDALLQEDGTSYFELQDGTGYILLEGLMPTLWLDFENSTSLDSRITFTRASNATYFNSAGVLTTAGSGVARFDYNPSTLQPRGLLIEEQRTNSLLQSEAFNEAVWGKSTATVSANAAIAPDGAMTADKFIANNGTAGYLDQSATYLAGTTYTWSFFAKSAERNYVSFLVYGTNFGGTNLGRTFTLTGDGTVGALAGTSAPTAATITPVGNGWFRCTFTAVCATGHTAASFQIQDGVNGDGTSGRFLWGAQLEAGAFATSYIPTTTTALTRNADVASMTGTNFSSWYNASQGSLFAQGQMQGVGTTPGNYVSIDDGTSTNRIQLRRSTIAGNANFRFVSSAGSIDVNFASGSNTALNKMAAAIAASDQQAANNGTLFTGITPVATLPTVTRMVIGDGIGGTPANGWIARIAYYPTRLPNATLQALTA